MTERHLTGTQRDMSALELFRSRRDCDMITAPDDNGVVAPDPQEAVSDK